MSHLVIFDCDGVLVDSETLSAQVMRTMARELGASFTGDSALAFIQGRKVAEWTAELGEMVGRELPEEFVPEFRKRCTDAFDRDLVATDGIEDVLTAMEAPFCCASSAPMQKILHVLGHTGLLRFFPEDRLYSAYEVKVWKPDPGLFLHAAARHGVAPERCAVVEDSPPGVLAGIRAGMTVFAYAPEGIPATGEGAGKPGTAEVSEGSLTTFASMRELPALLRRWRSTLPETPVPYSTPEGMP
ncbi:HAD family hydrolase [Streptomyces sp. YU58]|uniref:HAD family hydrolase n=1 Tax=Streptomyces sp. SX92 TaxID=3158972 RepID=UPI0027B96827|nr:HAD-IA family hydrolase [Streptomyces coralus]WLW51169.1 HAD-IA family hydrolase [Streptomyces coralus]